MASPNLMERLSELLGLPIKVIQAYGKPQEHAVFRPTRTKIGTVHYKTLKVAPRYVTLKEVPAVAPPAEKMAPPRRDENELYEQWRDASNEQKPEVAEKLFHKVRQHAEAVMWRKMPEADKRLARDIASTVIEQLGKFNGDSKFSTWVHQIILNLCNLHLRKKKKDQNRYYVSENPDDDINLKDPRSEAAFARAEERADLEPIERLVKELPSEDYVLLDCRLDGMTIADASKRLGVSEDAAESRWRRLEARLRKEIEGT